MAPALQGARDAPPALSRREQVLARLLWACIYGIIARQTLLVRRRASSSFSAVDTYAGADIAFMFLAAGTLLVSGQLARTWRSVLSLPVSLLLGYYALAAMSAIWSAVPQYSAYRALEFSVLFLGAMVALSTAADFAKAEKVFVRLGLLTVVLQSFVHLRTRGFALNLAAWHTNSYSASAAMVFAYCALEYLAMGAVARRAEESRTRFLGGYGLLALAALALGTSSASNVAAAYGIMVALLFLGNWWLIFGGLWVGVLLFLIGGGGEVVRALLFPGKTEYALETMSGRTLIWSYYWQKFLQSPIWGHGFGVVSSGRDQAFAALSHNSAFSALIGTGLLGAGTFLGFVATVYCRAFGVLRSRRPGALGCVAAITAGFVNSLGMPLVGDRWTTTTVVFVNALGLLLIHVPRSAVAGPREREPVRRIQAGLRQARTAGACGDRIAE